MNLEKKYDQYTKTKQDQIKSNGWKRIYEANIQIDEE
jgi:hypothetical protein